jgi:hypothetical protein
LVFSWRWKNSHCVRDVPFALGFKLNNSRSAVIDHLNQSGNNTSTGKVFLYCDYKQATEQTLINMLGSLLRQLIQQQGQVIDGLLMVYKSHKQRGLVLNIAERSKWLQVASSKYTQLFCMVDALDELAENTRLKLIAEITKLPQYTKTILTSRHSLDTESHLPGCPQLEIQATDADLRSYVINRALEEPRLGKHVQKDPNLLEELVNTIISKARGM